MKANSFSNTHYFHNFHITNAKRTGALNFPSVGKELPVPPCLCEMTRAVLGGDTHFQHASLHKSCRSQGVCQGHMAG